MPARLAPLALIGLAALLATPAVADASIYRGMVGKSPVLLELSQPAESAKGDLVGRYFYASKGVDIPLAADKVAKGILDLAEEAPCTDKICHDAPDGQKPRPPIGAHWHLSIAAGGGYLSGTWTDAGSGKVLPLSFTLIDARKLPADFDGTAQGLTTVLDALTSGENELTTLNSPYDFMKFDEAPYVKGEPKTFGASTISYWTDPRTKFAFPRIASLEGGTDISAANHFLEQQHWLNSVVALQCESQIYQGFGWTEGSADMGVGTLGGMDDASFEVSYLSPTVLTYLDAGSDFCTGAHPDDHADYYNLDIRTGKPLDLSLIFKDWVAMDEESGDIVPAAKARLHADHYTWSADDKLQAFVKAHLSKEDANDPDCGDPSLLASNLDITFVDGDKVAFALDRLPFVIASCDAILFQMPITALKPWLTPEAADYFPVLKP